MHKILAIIFMLILIESCNDKKDCCDAGPPAFPEMKVLDSAGNDLLNPENPNSYPHSEIKLWTLRDGSKRNLSFGITQPNEQIGSLHYSLYTVDSELNYLEQENYREFFLSLNGTSIDTIALTLDDGKITQYEFNGEVWTLDNYGYFIIIK